MKTILSILLGLIFLAPQPMQANADTLTPKGALLVLAKASAKAVWGFSEILADSMITGGSQAMLILLKHSQKGIDAVIQGIENPSKVATGLSARAVVAAAITAGMAYGTYHMVLKPTWNRLIGNKK